MTDNQLLPPDSFHVEVSEHHIRNGLCGDGKSCAVSKAINSLYPEANVETDGVCIYITHDGVGKTYVTPQEVWNWIQDFDSGEDVQPIEFTLYRE